MSREAIISCKNGDLETFVKCHVDGCDVEGCFATACRNNHINIVAYMLKNGIEMDSNPLYWPSYNGSPELFDLLVAFGAKPDIDESFWTPVVAASYNGHVDIIKRLYAIGADMSYQWEDNGVNNNAITFTKTGKKSPRTIERQQVRQLLLSYGVPELEQ